MKSIIFAAAALSSLSLAAAPAAAQSADAARAVTGYGSLGYSHYDSSNAPNLGGITGRLGARFGRYVGAEAEGTFGVRDKEGVVGGVPYKTEMKRSVAAYAVGYVPLSERLDLFGRVGLANTKIETTTAAGGSSFRRDSVNYGGGAQYFLTPNDGLRAEYTRQSYRDGPGHANVWGASYVRKF
jgi:opacity protein-like surface antigen